MRVLITGAAGQVGAMIVPRLRAGGAQLRFMDLTPIHDVHTGEQLIVGSVTERELIDEAMRGVDAVVHLAGIARESTWDAIVEVNVSGTQAVLQAAVPIRARVCFIRRSWWPRSFRFRSTA